MKCLNCDKEVVQVAGKRQRKYCSDNCRAKYGQLQKKLERAINKVMDDPKNKKEMKSAHNNLVDYGRAEVETTKEGGKIKIKDVTHEPKPGSYAYYAKYGKTE